jgi:hypothetical protein
MELGGNEYASFFYRTVHIYYFEEKSLRWAAEAAGYSTFRPRYLHRFNFANFVGWLKQGKPSGNQGDSSLGPGFDRLWQGILEERGVADYLYAYLSN